MTTKTDRAKKIAKFVVGTSVGFTVSNVMINNTHAKKRRHKAEAFIGGTAVGLMVADSAEDWTDRKIDAIVAGWNELKGSVKSARQ